MSNLSRAFDSVSGRYTILPTARIVSRLRELDWVPGAVEEERIRSEARPRRGVQKHLLRFRRAEQMETLDEWNVELILVNSHDAGCAYQLHAGLDRRICSNGLVISDGQFETIRFRHAGLEAEEVVRASFRLIDYMPRVGEMVNRFSAIACSMRASHRGSPSKPCCCGIRPWLGRWWTRRRCSKRPGSRTKMPICGTP